MEVKEGQLLAGKYRVERILGEGGMGVVLAALHVQLDQRVALKLLRPTLVAQLDAANRFLREARAAARIQSEHVARVMDVGTLDSGAPYIVMELLEGSDLGQVLHRSGALGVADAVDYVVQACEAIAEAHRLGVVHRDLKPPNLFLTRRTDGSPLIKVLDFGISKAAPGLEPPGAAQVVTATGLVMGSPHYMAPEQFRNTKQVDPRADLWSLGVVLYELATATRPFEADGPWELMNVIHACAFVPLRERRGDAPPGLDAVIARCLRRDPNDRYQDVGELALALAPFGHAATGLLAERIGRIARASRAAASGSEPPGARSDRPPGSAPAAQNPAPGAPPPGLPQNPAEQSPLAQNPAAQGTLAQSTLAQGPLLQSPLAQSPLAQGPTSTAPLETPAPSRTLVATAKDPSSPGERPHRSLSRPLLLGGGVLALVSLTVLAGRAWWSEGADEEATMDRSSTPEEVRSGDVGIAVGATGGPSSAPAEDREENAQPATAKPRRTTPPEDSQGEKPEPPRTAPAAPEDAADPEQQPGAPDAQPGLDTPDAPQTAGPPEPLQAPPPTSPARAPGASDADTPATPRSPAQSAQSAQSTPSTPSAQSAQSTPPTAPTARPRPRAPAKDSSVFDRRKW